MFVFSIATFTFTIATFKVLKNLVLELKNQLVDVATTCRCNENLSLL